jgi:hypothetical protein
LLRGITEFHPLGQILLDNLAASCGEMPSFDDKYNFYVTAQALSISIIVSQNFAVF